MNLEFNTTEYVMSYGHSPRGRGSWAFSFTRDYGFRPGDSEPFFTPGSMTFS